MRCDALTGISHICADAENYPNLFSQYCGGDRQKCDLDGLQWHWQHSGEKEGYVTTCIRREPPDKLRCFAENYPDIFEGFCQKDRSKCDLDRLHIHWVRHRARTRTDRFRDRMFV